MQTMEQSREAEAMSKDPPVTLESLLKTVRLQFQSLDSKLLEIMEILQKGTGKREEKMEFSNPNPNGTILRELPKDLVEDEILCRVPATCLKGLASTCKRWNRLFNGDMRFARKHIDKAAKQFLVLVAKSYGICPAIVNLDGRVPSVEVKSELSLVDSHSKYSAEFYISAVYHCDGLLLCTNHMDPSRFVVWNPFTGETRWIQASNHPSKGHCDFVLGYHQEDNTRSYKILVFSLCRKYFEIYELSSDSWRVLDDVIPPGWDAAYSDHNVNLKGNSYWFARDETETERLLKFDFSTEKSVPLPLPYQCHFFEVLTLSAVRDEKLSVLLQRHVTSKTEIWVTNKIDDETTQVVTWTKLLALDLSPELQVSSFGSFLLDEEKKTVMICERWHDMEDETGTNMKDLIYIVGEDNEVTQVGFEVDDDRCGIAILNYVPSLVQIEQAGRKRKRGPDL